MHAGIDTYAEVWPEEIIAFLKGAFAMGAMSLQQCTEHGVSIKDIMKMKWFLEGLPSDMVEMNARAIKATRADRDAPRSIFAGPLPSAIMPCEVGNVAAHGHSCVSHVQCFACVLENRTSSGTVWDGDGSVCPWM